MQPGAAQPPLAPSSRLRPKSGDETGAGRPAAGPVRPASGDARPGAVRPSPVDAPAQGAAKPIDRERILERYRRPSSEAARPSASAPEASGPSAADVTRRRDAHRDAQREAVAGKRQESRQLEASEVQRARDAYRSAQAEKVAAKRGEWRADQAANLADRRSAYAEAASREYRRRTEAPGAEQQQLERCGTQFARWHGYGVGLGLGLGFSWCSPYGWYWNSYWNNCWPGAGWWWNGWNNVSYWGWGWGLGAYSYSWWCHPLSLGYRWWWGGWPAWNHAPWPGAYASWWGAAPVYYSSMLVNSDPSPASSVTIYVDSGDAVEVYSSDGASTSVHVSGKSSVQGQPSGEAVQYRASEAPATDGGLARVLERGPDSASRAANQNLAQGDAAFRERRYADAVHFYAKAIEFRPNEGVMYLVLADALLATGDYHYGAFALRRALELDPSLAQSDIDKHEFYATPAEFSEQLQLLERFLSDHQGDADARLLLAANYLFGRKPALAIDLLESGASAAVRNEAAGQLILAAAKRARGAR